MTLAFLNIGTQEMILIVIVILLLFGGKKLPELARGLGRGIRDFKDASEGIKREISDQINNFEKDLDVNAAVKPNEALVPVDNTSTEVAVINDTPTDVAVIEDTPAEVAVVEEVAEKKFPNLSVPENTYQHNPGGHPVDGTEYYKYGYNDHFAEEEIASPMQTEVVEGERIEDKPSDSKLA